MSIENPISTVAYFKGTNTLLFGTGMPNSESNTLGIRSLNPLDRQRFVPTAYDLQKFQGHKAEITSVEVMSGNTILISGSRDGTVRFWSVEEGRETASITVGSPINSLALSPDETQVLVATQENFLRVYDAKSHQETHQLPGHAVQLLDVCWSPDGSHFVTASGDRTIRVWNRETMETTAVLTGHSDRVNSVAASQSGQYVVSGSDDGTVRLWDVSAKKQIDVFEGHAGPVLSVDIDPYLKQAVSGSMDGTARIWKLDLDL
jgi:WD40 repeat protein